MPVQVSRHWTAAEVRELQDEQRHWPRFELIGGELLVTNAPRPEHQAAVAEFLMLLKKYCDHERVGVTLLSPSDIELAPDTITQPDVFVFPLSARAAGDEPMTWANITSLVLAIEIVSPSSERTDRITKRDFYLANSVADYWVVDLDARLVEMWTAKRATPTVARESLSWKPSGAREALAIDLTRLFSRVRELLRSGG